MYSYISIAKDFFQQVEHYNYINGIPSPEIFGLSAHFYLYTVIILIFALFLILKGFFLIRRAKYGNLVPRWKPSFQILIHFILIFWLLTSARWLYVQAHWIKNDQQDFKSYSLEKRRKQMVVRLMQAENFPLIWQDFYDFLEFSRQQIPQNSKVYVLPVDPTFQVWSKYWLAPDLVLTDSSKKADYIISFNVELPEIINDFKEFKKFGFKKVILIRSDLINNQSND